MAKKRPPCPVSEQARELTRCAVLERALDKVTRDKDNAYHERDLLVCVLSKVFPSHLCRHAETDVSWEAEWRWIVCVHTPQGMCSWHIHETELSLFSHLRVTDNDWDGHTTQDKYARLEKLGVTWAHEG